MARTQDLAACDGQAVCSPQCVQGAECVRGRPCYCAHGVGSRCCCLSWLCARAGLQQPTGQGRAQVCRLPRGPFTHNAHTVMMRYRM